MVVMASSISTPCELLSGTNAAGSGSASAAIERAIILVLPLYTCGPWGGEQHRNGARELIELLPHGQPQQGLRALSEKGPRQQSMFVFVCKTAEVIDLNL